MINLWQITLNLIIMLLNNEGGENMLDQQGLTLAEVNKRYPSIFQKLGYDVALDYDSTYKPKVLSSFELAVNNILTLLLMKPGQYPSIPELGIDIDQYLHEYADDPNITQTIINKIYDQCNRLKLMINLDIECSIDKLSNGLNALVVQITGDEQLAYGAESNRVIIGISYDKLNQIYARKQYIKA